MHPEMARQMMKYQEQDMLARAAQRRTVRFLKLRRKATPAADTFVAPRIPDFVDGSFHTGREVAAASAGSAPAGRTAA